VLVTEAEEDCSTGHPNQRKAMANWNTLVKHTAGPQQGLKGFFGTKVG